MTDASYTRTTDDASARQTVDRAAAAMRTALVDIAAMSGAEIIEQQVFPGSVSTDRYAEPLAGLQVAGTLVSIATRLQHEYAERARGAGITWQQIGEALDLGQDSDDSAAGQPDEAAFERFAGAPGAYSWQSSFGYRCASCRAYVTDRGPYNGHPADNESGHADGCERFAAEVAGYLDDDWDAE